MRWRRAIYGTVRSVATGLALCGVVCSPIACATHYTVEHVVRIEIPEQIEDLAELIAGLADAQPADPNDNAAAGEADPVEREAYPW